MSRKPGSKNAVKRPPRIKVQLSLTADDLAFLATIHQRPATAALMIIRHRDRVRGVKFPEL